MKEPIFGRVPRLRAPPGSVEVHQDLEDEKNLSEFFEARRGKNFFWNFR
jgi:hypothetical protein